MNIIFDEEVHGYTVDGEEYPSVTRILSAEGLSDFSFANESHRHRGTLVHQIADLLDLGWEPTMGSAEEIISRSPWDPAATAPQLVPYGYAYCNFLLKYRPEWQFTEKPVASKLYRYAGRLDRFGLIGGKRKLVDIKSGEPGDSAAVQEALYGLALEETEGAKAEESFALWLRSNGDYKIVPANGLALRIGIAAVTLYHYRAERKLFS